MANIIRKIGKITSLCGLLAVSSIGKSNASDLINNPVGNTGVQIESTLYRPIISKDSNNYGKSHKNITLEYSNNVFAKTSLLKRISAGINFERDKLNTKDQSNSGNSENARYNLSDTRYSFSFPVNFSLTKDVEFGAGPMIKSLDWRYSFEGNSCLTNQSSENNETTIEEYCSSGYFEKENQARLSGIEFIIGNKRIFPFNVSYSSIKGRAKTSEIRIENDTATRTVYDSNNQVIEDEITSERKREDVNYRSKAFEKELKINVPLDFGKTSLNFSYGSDYKKFLDEMQSLKLRDKTIGIQAKYNYKHLIIGAGYYWKISSEKRRYLESDYELSSTMTSEKFGITAGYLFGSNSDKNKK